MGSTNKNDKLTELQVFSGIAILCVVLIHSNAYYLSEVLKLQSYIDAKFIVRLLDNFIHSAVPMFVFIAGYKYGLNNLNDNYKLYALKKIKRVIKPFLVLSIIFYIKSVLQSSYPLTTVQLVVKFLNIFRGYNSAYHLWYIPMYIFISLTYPIVYKVFKKDMLRVLMICLIVWIQKKVSLNISLLSTHPFDFVYYYMFFEMGVLFCKYNIKSKIQKWSFYILSFYVLGAIMLTLNIVPTYYGKIQEYLLWPLCVVAYYVLSLKLVNSRILNYLGKYSFYIFLLHEPIICTKTSYLLNSMGIYTSMLYVFIVCIVTITLTLLLVKIIEKTFLRNILFSESSKNKKINKLPKSVENQIT